MLITNWYHMCACFVWSVWLLVSWFSTSLFLKIMKNGIWNFIFTFYFCFKLVAPLQSLKLRKFSYIVTLVSDYFDGNMLNNWNKTSNIAKFQTHGMCKHRTTNILNRFSNNKICWLTSVSVGEKTLHLKKIARQIFCLNCNCFIRKISGVRGKKNTYKLVVVKLR